jgi:hypothetical protein
MYCYKVIYPDNLYVYLHYRYKYIFYVIVNNWKPFVCDIVPDIYLHKYIGQMLCFKYLNIFSRR